MLPVENAVELSHAFVLERLDAVGWLNQKCPRFTPVEKDGYEQRFVKHELDVEADSSMSFPVWLNQKCPRLTSVEKDGYDQRFVRHELDVEADVFFPCPLQSGNG